MRWKVHVRKFIVPLSLRGREPSQKGEQKRAWGGGYCDRSEGLVLHMCDTEIVGRRTGGGNEEERFFSE